MKEFEAMSGLKANQNKSAVYFSSVDDGMKRNILEVTGYVEDKLPIKYLGVPLISTKLSRADCEILIEKVTSRINSWASRFLSYAGRLQLIKSVLASIQTYWCRMFILPKRVIQIIEQKFANFLWSGVAMKSTKAKVNWDAVALPKEEGGLGLKKSFEWNRALIAKHIWSIFCRSGSIWIAWIKNYLLKGRSFWTLKLPSDCSWSWRKILKLRGEMRLFVKHKIGNGEKTFLWFDNWHPLGPIDLRWGQRVRYDAASSLEAKVSSVINGNQWGWPITVTSDLNEIRDSIPATMVPNQSREDSVSWTPSANGCFSASATWEVIRKKGQIVPWSELVWYAKCISKHAFICWLAMLNRLSTQDRMLDWGLIHSAKCVFCQASWEDRNHLFFGCGWTSAIWKKLLKICLISRSHGQWEEEIEWLLKNCQGKSLSILLLKLCFASYIYHVWIERNNRMHGRRGLSFDVLFSNICWDVRIRVSSFRNCEYSKRNSSLCKNWGIDTQILKRR